MERRYCSGRSGWICSTSWNWRAWSNFSKAAADERGRFPSPTRGMAQHIPVVASRKTTWRRSVVNTLGDGTRDVHADPDAANLGWELHAKGLTAAEWSAIEALFQAASGMWQPFTF